MDSTNLKSFIADWAYAHKLCGDDAVLPILNLGVRFFYDKQTDKDYILLNDKKRMDLTDASSGLQSVIPMWVYLDYLFRKQYYPQEMSSSRTETENSISMTANIRKRQKKLGKREKSSLARLE